jgi:ATP-binding cassette subfamily B protein/subfamily B ATP-binding cassette protein MsbA
MTHFRRLSKYILRQWRTLALIAGLTVATPLVAALSPWPMKLVVDAATGAGAVPHWVGRLIEAGGVEPGPRALVVFAAVASLALFVIGSGLESALSLSWTAAGQRMVYELAADLFHHLQRLSLMFHGRRSVGDSLSRLGGDTWCVYTMTEGLLIAPIQHGVTLATVGLFAWQLDPVLTLLSLSVAPVLAAAARYFGPRLKRRAEDQRKTASELTSVVHQTMSSIPLVQLFATRERNTDRYRALAGGAVALAQRGVALRGIYGMVTGTAAAVGTAAVLLVGARRVLAGDLTPGGLLVFVAYLRTMQSAAQGLMQTHATAKTVEAGADRVLEILDSHDRVADGADAVELRVPPAGRGIPLSFDAVTFGYEPGRAVLSDVTLSVAPGEVVALVGPTGAGKSTIAALVPRLFDPWDGRVTVAGRDARQWTLASLRRQIAVVPQEPALLPVSVYENIAFGMADARREDVERCAQAAGAAEFIRRLPDGYDTVLAERGATLSVGQRQRLTIARAILRDAAIVILDEPTSALDAATEHDVMRGIRRLMSGRTGLVIAHRLSTVRFVDRIAVVDGGRIVAQGTHAELLESSPLYRSFYEARGARRGRS